MRALALRAALVFALSCPVAHAEERPPVVPLPPGLHLFPIWVRGHPEGLKVTLATEEGGKPFLYCESTCAAWAYEGDYWIAVRGTSRTAAGRKEIRLKGPSTIDVRPREKEEQSAPTTVGFVLLGASLGAFSLAVAMDDDDRNQNDAGASTQTILAVGSFLGATAGLVLLLVGGARDTTVPYVDVQRSD